MSLSTKTHKIAVTAILSAAATVLMFLSFPIPFLIPPFIKMDFSELPALLAAFSLGPVSGVMVCLVKNLINLLFTTTSGVGELCNFLLGVAAMGLDAVPIEGFDAAILDEEFGLKEKGFTSLVVVPVGHHSVEDFNATLPKSRLPLSTIVTEC